MYQNRFLMIIFLVFWIYVLRLYFFEVEHSLIHFLLGLTIFGVLLYRYRTIVKEPRKKTQATITMLIAVIVFATLFVWYVKPLFG